MIASFANKGTGEAWPSRATLSAITGIESREVRRVIHELRDGGFLAIKERDGRANVYRLTFTELTRGDLATGGDLPPGVKKPPTRGEITTKPGVKKPPITMKEQSKNNEDDADKKKDATPKVIWDGQRFTVPGILLESWGDAYPNVNLDIAIKRAASWYLAHPAKKKKNYAKFLNNWFGNVRSDSPEYINPDVQAASDAELIRGAEKQFPNPDERADFFYQRQMRGLRVPAGVECKPMPEEKEVVA